MYKVFALKRVIAVISIISSLVLIYLFTRASQSILKQNTNSQNSQKIQVQPENKKEDGLTFYKCAGGNSLYINKINNSFLSVTILHSDDTYSSVTLRRKNSDEIEVFADEYNEHKLTFNKGKASFFINDVEVVSDCKKSNNTKKNDLPIIIDKNLIDNFSDRVDYMFYGDPALNRVVIMKVSTFEKVGEFKIDGQNIYCVDHVNRDKSYVMARGSDFVQIIKGNQKNGFELGKKIALPFHPRTGAKNEFLNLELVSGKDKAMFALIDLKTDKVLSTGGINKVTHVKATYGGSNATGHAKWISPNYFMFSDRQRKEISLYHVLKKSSGELDVKKTDSVVLPTTVHTFFDVRRQSEGVYKFFATLEGNDTGTEINGGILRITANEGKLILGKTVEVSGGVHHARVSYAEQNLIYVPAGGGVLSIIDKTKMKVIKTIKTGKGAGHTVFVPERNIAIIINHRDTFVTVIDTNKKEFIKNIEVAKDDPKYDTILQSHTARISPDNKYYYAFSPDSGTFFRINLETLELDKQLYVGGTPKQSSQPSELRS